MVAIFESCFVAKGVLSVDFYTIMDTVDFGVPPMPLVMFTTYVLELEGGVTRKNDIAEKGSFLELGCVYELNLTCLLAIETSRLLLVDNARRRLTPDFSDSLHGNTSM